MEMKLHFYKMGQYNNDVLALLYSEYIINRSTLEYQQYLHIKNEFILHS